MNLADVAFEADCVAAQGGVSTHVSKVKRDEYFRRRLRKSK